jgi:hypothetical protein
VDCLGSGHVAPQQDDATVGDRFLQRMFVARCWAAGSGPMGCLGGDDVVCDATIEEMSQAMFSVSSLRGHIIRLTKSVPSVQCSAVRSS